MPVGSPVGAFPRRRRQTQRYFFWAAVGAFVVVLILLFGLPTKSQTVEELKIKTFFDSSGVEVTAKSLNVPAAGPIFLPIPLMKQQTEYTCGAASVAAVLRGFGLNVTEAELAQEMKTNPVMGTAFAEITLAFHRRQIPAELKFSASVEDLRKVLIRGGVGIIEYQAYKDVEISTTLKNNTRVYPTVWDSGHYSVVIGIDDRQVYLMDPYQEEGFYSVLTIWDMEQRWHCLGGYIDPGQIDSRLVIIVDPTATGTPLRPLYRRKVPQNVRYTP